MQRPDSLLRYFVRRGLVEPPIGIPGAKRSRWWAWHQRNPRVYEEFEDATFRVVETGETDWSHWAIMQGVRWERKFYTFGEPFKISNDFIAYYGRLFVFLNPEHDGLFTFRGLKE